MKFVKFIGLLITLASVLAGNAHAQLPSLKKPTETKAAESAEKPEDTRKRLEQWQKEAKETLAQLDASNGTTPIPEGITPLEVEEYRRDLEQLIIVTSNALKNLDPDENERRAQENERSKEAWEEMRETAPFSILFLDDLENEREAIQARIKTFESGLGTAQILRGGMIDELKVAEDAASTALSVVQKAGSSATEAAKWRLVAARNSTRTLAARAAYFQAMETSLGQRIAAAKAELVLADRKIGTVRPQAVFSDEDLAKVEAATGSRVKGFQKDIQAVTKRLQTAVTEREKAQATLDLLRAKPADAETPSQIELAAFRLEVAETRVDSLQSVGEQLETLTFIENAFFQAYQARRVILQSEDESQRVQAIATLNHIAERRRAALRVLNNDLATSTTDLSNIESRAATITQQDPRFALLNELRAARSEKLAMLQRTHQAVTWQRNNLRRWLEDFEEDKQNAPLHEKIGDYASIAADAIKKTWSLEVMSYEDKIEVDGQTITGKIPVTLGMLVRALLFFVIGYIIAAAIANRIQRAIIARGHIAEAQARTLRTWAMIAVGVALALMTLSFLKIPLTVFAFFGGALAIGLGFGMQTLIKNFISGIIVLAERKIRVGDILDVDGIVGKVVEVNTRSSIIRSADDLETMIPNSVFLENRVTNWTLSNPQMRRSIRLGAAYGTDPSKMIRILTECATRHGLVCKDPAPFAIFEDFGENALIFVLYFWVELGKGGNPYVTASDLRLMIDKQMTECGIGVPFPQRDMHLTTGEPLRVEISSPAVPKSDSEA